MTAMTLIKGVDVTSGHLPPAGQRPGADKGDPQLGLLKIAPNAKGNISIWECQPGGWPINDRPDTEVAFILSGKAIITDEATSKANAVTAGDFVVLPPGWTGRWDVIETIRKVYAIY
ncbi:cupin domain-containing protein [Bradyrhizobium sp. 190]|uniref:cupin domain-containing protein n=1 Tax=Bradyrhizobium sp. 190 TaxID=2782658 RepID=UPI001FF98624|nr:cupin domain-containing protein [Bradyrhizobium sp. 190]MCK1517530.1 cupin domain-containing protein [Bradyrhizobium sp. 190]